MDKTKINELRRERLCTNCGEQNDDEDCRYCGNPEHVVCAGYVDFENGEVWFR